MNIFHEHSQRQQQLSRADVLLVTVTDVEGRAVLGLFEQELGYKYERRFIGDKTYFELGVVSGARIFMVQTEMGTGGPSGATLTVQAAIHALSPAAVVMVGIAFGLDAKKHNLGDILVSKQLLAYELQRVGTGSDGQVIIRSRGDRPSASPRLLDRFRGGCFDWQSPQVHFGLVLSGEKLIDHRDYRDQLHQIEPEAIGGEMEGSGLYAAAQRNKVEWIVVKAICDWADGNKSQNKHVRQQKAAENAARFTFHVLRLGGFVESNIDPLNPEARQQYRPPFDEVLLTPPKHLVGREKDLQWLRARLASGGTTGISALGGMGGIGKTALAAVAIHQMRAEGHFPDGIAVVLCLDKIDAHEVIRQVLARFDPQRRQPETNELSKLIDAAHLLLDGKNALVVLDNVEPGLDIELVVKPLRATSTTLLLTARHMMPRAVVSPGESRSLDLLPLEDAVDLFARSIGKPTAQSLSPTEHSLAEEIVLALDRHTLAVKLAGAYALDCKRSLRELIKELRDPQQGLELADGETPRAVALSFAHSTDSLSEDTQRLFAALATFPTADFGRRVVLALGTALHLTNPNSAVDMLGRRVLIEASVNDMLPEESDYERLRLHPLMRAFAIQKFSKWSQDNRDATQQAMTAYYAQYVSKVPHSALSIDDSNIVGALEWAHTHEEEALVVALCLGMHTFWHERGRTIEGLGYLPWGISAAEVISRKTDKREDRLNAADLAVTYGLILQNVGQIDEAERRLMQLLDIFQQELCPQGEGKALMALGEIARLHGKLETAEDYYQQSLRLFRMVQDRRSEGEVLTLLGQFAKDQGQLEKAQHFFELSLLIHREIGDLRGQAWNLSYLGRIAQYREQMKKAEGFYQEAWILHRTTQDRQSQAWVQGWLGQIALIRGNLEDAERYYQGSLTIHRQIQVRRGEGTAIYLLGRLAEIRGQAKEAEDYYKQCLAIYRELQDRRSIGWRFCDLGRIAQTRGQLLEAELYYEQSLAILRQVHDRQGESEALTCFGRLAKARGDLDEASQLFKQALDINHEVEYKSGECLVLSLLGEIALARGQYDIADRLFNESLYMVQEGENRLIQGRLLYLSAVLAEARGDVNNAEAFYHEILTILTEVQSCRYVTNSLLSHSPT